MTTLESIPPVTSADLSAPVTAEYFTSRGASPAQAALLAAGHNEKAGRSSAPPPISAIDAAESARLHDQQAGQVDPSKAAVDPKLAGHLDAVYAPPASSADYVIPTSDSQLSGEAMAADRALVDTLHVERVPRDIGNAILMDLQAGRGSAKSAETVNALRGWTDQILTRVKANPALAASMPPGMTADALLAALSPETALALTAWVRYRTDRR